MPGDIPLYVVPVGGQGENVVGDALVPALGQVDEGAPLATYDLFIPGVTIAAQKVLLTVELNARLLELHEVWTTCGNSIESFRVVLLGAVACTCAGIGKVVGAVVGPVPLVFIGLETIVNACHVSDNLRTHHCL